MPRFLKALEIAFGDPDTVATVRRFVQKTRKTLLLTPLISCFNGTKEILLRLQIMSSFDQKLVKGDLEIVSCKITILGLRDRVSVMYRSFSARMRNS